MTCESLLQPWGVQFFLGLGKPELSKENLETLDRLSSENTEHFQPQ
jgi:hypothetical protein